MRDYLFNTAAPTLHFLSPCVSLRRLTLFNASLTISSLNLPLNTAFNVLSVYFNADVPALVADFST